MVRPLLVLLLLMSAVSACQARSTTRDSDNESKLQVVATMSVFADFANKVGGDHVNVTTLVPIGGDPHTFEPRPSDAVILSQADIVLHNGLGLAPWFEALKTNVSGELVTLTDGIDADARKTSGKVDPHMWMVPDFVSSGYLSAIEGAFVAADPANTTTYRSNAATYRLAIDQLDERITEAIQTIPSDNRKIVTSHDAYSYFAAEYGIEVVGTITGVSTEEEPSAQAVSELIGRIRSENVPAVFFETTINPALAERVAADAGVKLGEPLYGDSVGEPGSGASEYTTMMEANVSSIVSALGGST